MTSRSMHRGEVFLVSLGPTRGGEIRKMHPCVIVSPDGLNVSIEDVHCCATDDRGASLPLSSALPVRETGRTRRARPQIRTVDRERLVRRVGRLSPPAVSQVLQVLQEMFAE